MDLKFGVIRKVVPIAEFAVVTNSEIFVLHYSRPRWMDLAGIIEIPCSALFQLS